MKFCTQCGCEVQEGANVCTTCGKPVGTQAPIQQNTMPYGAPQPNFSQPNFPQQNTPNFPQSPKGKLTVDLVINIIALVFGAVSLTYALFNLLYIFEEGYLASAVGNVIVPSVAFIAGMIGYYKSEKKIMPLLAIIFSGVYFFCEIIGTFGLIFEYFGR